MIRRSKLFFFLLPLVLATVLVARAASSGSDIGWDVALRRALWTVLSKDVRILMFIHMPGLFPISYLCNFQDSAGNKRTLIPGDLAKAESGEARLWCPGNVMVELSTGTSIRLEQEGKNLSLYFLEGKGHVSLSTKPLLIQTGQFYLRAQGESGESLLTVQESSEGFTLACLRGAIQGKLHRFSAAKEGARQILASQNCRFALQKSGSINTIYLHSGDAVQVSDMDVQRAFWPPFNAAKVIQSLSPPSSAMGNSVRISMEPNNHGSQGVNLRWHRSELGKASCRLLTQQAENAAPTVAFSFETAEQSGSLILQPAFLRLWTSLSCESSSKLVSSNVLSPVSPQ